MRNVLTYNDYYPFGSLMPGRYSGGNSYRYSFQGQESDGEIKGEGNSVNYKYRMHDPRLGRFLSVDPLAPDYPHNSPYAFSENRVIDMVELEGLEMAVPAGVNRVGTQIKRATESSINDMSNYFSGMGKGISNLFSGKGQKAGTILTKKDANVAKKEDDTEGLESIDRETSVDEISEAFGAQPGIDPGGVEKFGSVMEGMYKSVKKAMAAVKEYFKDNPVEVKTPTAKVPNNDGSLPKEQDSENCTFCGAAPGELHEFEKEENNEKK